MIAAIQQLGIKCDISLYTNAEIELNELDRVKCFQGMKENIHRKMWFLRFIQTVLGSVYI